MTLDAQAFAESLKGDGYRRLAILHAWMNLVDDTPPTPLSSLKAAIVGAKTQQARQKKKLVTDLPSLLGGFRPGEKSAIADLAAHLESPLPDGVCKLPAATNDTAALVTLVSDFRFRFRVYSQPEPASMNDIRVMVIAQTERPQALARTLIDYNPAALTLLREAYAFA